MTWNARKRTLCCSLQISTYCQIATIYKLNCEESCKHTYTHPQACLLGKNEIWGTSVSHGSLKLWGIYRGVHCSDTESYDLSF